MAKLAPYVVWQLLDDNGDPLSNGKVYTYEAGTTTDKATYTDSTGVTANANPIILDSSGRANIWLDDGAYKFVVHDENDSLVEEVDNIAGDSANAFGASYALLSANTTIDSTYQNQVIKCDAAITLSLLAVSSAGEGFYFTVKNESGGTVVLDPDSSESIDGASTLSLSDGESAIVYCTGTAWETLFKGAVSLSSNNTFSGNQTYQGLVTFRNRVYFPDDGALDITSGTLDAPTGFRHTVDTESAASTDDLTTIPAGSDGQQLSLTLENASRVVTVKNSGNIDTITGEDVVLSAVNPVRFEYSSAATAWVQVNGIDYLIASDLTDVSSAGSFGSQLYHIQDQKSSGTDGGSSSVGNNTRTLNTEVTSEITGASLSSNVVTLPAGTYYMEAYAACYQGGENRLIFYNVDDTANIFVGASCFSSAANGGYNLAPVSGRFTLAAEKDVRLDHYLTGSQGTNGLGRAASISGEVEVYADLKIWKIG